MSIEYQDLKINDNFGQCCDTCIFRPFEGGYSGRKNCGYCCKIDQVVCRSNICQHYIESKKTEKKSIGGMKGQVRWIKDQLDSIKRCYQWAKERGYYDGE